MLFITLWLRTKISCFVVKVALYKWEGELSIISVHVRDITFITAGGLQKRWGGDHEIPLGGDKNKDTCNQLWGGPQNHIVGDHKLDIFAGVIHKMQDNANFFNFYGLCRIGYGCIDYFLIHIKDLVGFLGTQGQ